MKKKFLCVLLACLILVLAAACGAKSETPDVTAAEEAAVKLYWNVDRNEFVGDSSAGMNSRQRDADGFYSVRFAVDGEEVTYKVEKARLIEQIDSMDIMGLQIDEQGIITAVYDPKDITGGEVASMYYVVFASDETLTVSADEALENDYKMFDIDESTGIYNVTGMDPVGHKDVAVTSDRIRAFKNEEGKVTHVFIVERFGYWPGKTEVKHCQHCDQEVEWRVWEEKNALPTDSAHWILDNKVVIAAQHKIETNKEIILDLNGKSVTGPDGKRVYAMTGENAFLAILDSSEEGTGKIVGSGSPDNGGVIYVRYGTFELYGGTIDASAIATKQYASAVRVNNDCVFNMYGGKIIGGKVIATENAEEKVTNAGYGGTLYVTGTMNMYDGVITGGSCIESGGNIFVGKAGTLNLHGGKITDGYASKKGGNLAGTGKINIYEATVSGGSAKTYGGNIFTGKGGVVTLCEDAALVSGGSAKQGGNIYIENGAAVKVDAGTLKFGHSYAHGGSVAVYGECTIGAGKVLNGNADEQGGNIFVGKTGVLTVNGAYVQDGTAGTKGGNIAGTGKVNLRAGYVNGGEAKDYGGNFFSGMGAVVTVSDDWAIISEGTAKQGGNYYIENGAEVTMTAGRMEKGSATAHGGSVAVYGVFNLSGGIITGNTAAEQGGNVFVGKAGTLNVAGGSVEKGTAVKGGNIAGTGKILLDNGKISDGTAKESGGNLYVSGKINMNGGIISGGTATAAKDAKGGSVFIDGAADPGAQFVMSGGVITGGNAGAKGYGGNVYLTRTAKDGQTTGTAHFTMTGGEISGGYAMRGGNVFAGRDCSFTLKNGQILNGKVADVGGNINVTGTLKVEGGSIEGGYAKQGGNVYVAAGSNTSPTAVFELSGGTISGGEATTTAGNVAALGEFTMTGGTITGGICKVSGDHKYAYNVYSKPGEAGCTFTMTGGTIAGGVRVNTDGVITVGGNAKITGSETESGLTFSKGSMKTTGFSEGANIYLSKIKSNPFCTDAKDGDQNYFTSGEAGKVVVYEEGALHLINQSDVVTLWTSTTSLPTTTGKYRLNGDVTVSSASTTEADAQIELDLNGKTIKGSNNTRIYVVSAGASLTIKGNGTIKATRESTADAGAIYIKGAGGVFNLEGGSIDASGVTVKNGAAVYVAAGTTFNMSGGTITGGTATSNGGNVYVAAGAGTFNLSGGTIEKGKAATAGNVCALGVFNMTGGSISGGTATSNATGGNIYTTPGNNGGSFTMTGGTIDGLVRVNSTGSVVLGGTAKIAGGETNLTLSDKPARLQTTGFSAGAEISVNPEYDAYASDEKHFGVIGTAGDEQYIMLDGEGEIVLTDGKLYLKEEESGGEGGNEGGEDEEEELYPGFTKWEATDSLPTTPGKYYLTNDITLGAAFSVTGEYTFELNGHDITGTNIRIFLFNTNNGGTLNIYNTRTDDIGVIKPQRTSSYTGNGGIVCLNKTGNTFNLYGGILDASGMPIHSTNGLGGAVYAVSGTTFNMYGGTVTGGTGKDSANMYLSNGSTFNMTGGTITGFVQVANGANVRLGGSAKITGGSKNLTLTDGAQISTTGFAAGANISINSTVYGETNSFGTGVAGDEAFIHGDNGSAAAITENGKLYLVDPAVSASVEAE